MPSSVTTIGMAKIDRKNLIKAMTEFAWNRNETKRNLQISTGSMSACDVLRRISCEDSYPLNRRISSAEVNHEFS